MSPAFSSRRQAFSFIALLLFLLVLPLIVGRAGLFSRESAYEAMPVRYGPFSFMRRQIFEEKSDLDIVFVGSSAILFGVDTTHVQKELSARLGREAHVITLGSFFEGEDRNYLILKDLLEHRKVKVLVLNMVNEDMFRASPKFGRRYEQPYTLMYRFFQMGENKEALAGLPIYSQASLYAGAIMGTPRHLLSLIRSDLGESPNKSPIPETAQWSTLKEMILADAPPALNLGAEIKRAGYDERASSFVAFSPQPPRLPVESMIFSGEALAQSSLSARELNPYQKHFVRKMGGLLREHGVRLVLLHMPRVWPFERNEKVEEFTNWSDAFGMPIDLVGIPNKTLFSDLSDEDVTKLWCNKLHLNANGNAYFTSAITPALVESYVKNTTH